MAFFGSIFRCGMLYKCPEDFPSMKKKLKIIYYKDQCRGLGMCAIIAPQHFTLKRKKAILANGKQKKGTEEYSALIRADRKEAERIVKSGMACPVNAIRVIDMNSRKDLVQTRIITHGARRISARKISRRDFVMDPKGYFLIRADHGKDIIEIGLCREKNTVDTIITGKNPTDIYYALVKRRLLSRQEHAAYVGKELQKAYISLQLGIEYVQDSPLDFGKRIK